jgi:uncharacterized protein
VLQGDYLPRSVESIVGSRLETFPVVVLTGARQTGKSTLAHRVSEEERLYVTLDDVEVWEEATGGPDDLVARAPRMTLDEVQRSPDLLLAVKRAVDTHREPGRFLLTGSSNLLLMEKVSESLVGRADYLTLGPLTRRELLGLGRAGTWSVYFQEDVLRWREATLDPEPVPAGSWQELATTGGYPFPAHHLRSPEERGQWFDGYVRTYLERDLQDLSAVEQLGAFRRLMRAASLRVGQLLNQADLARDVGLPPTTAQRYVSLLETSYQVVLVEAFAVNRTKRLIKSPKIFWFDTGLALHLAGGIRPGGAHLENLVLGDLLAWREGKPRYPSILHWRTVKGAEVDLVVEWEGRALPVEVKSGKRIRAKDLAGLTTFLEEYPDLVPGALVLHDGTETYWIRDRILATPWWRVI